METKTNFFGIKEMAQNPLDNIVKEKLSMLLFAYPDFSTEAVADITTKCVTDEAAQKNFKNIGNEIKSLSNDFLKEELSKKFYQWVKVYEMPELSDLIKLSAFLNMEASDIIDIFYKGLRLFRRKEMSKYLKMCSVIFEKYKQVMTVNQFIEMLNIRLNLDKECVEAFSQPPLDKTLLAHIISEKNMQMKNFFGIRALQNNPLGYGLKQKLSFLLFLHPDYMGERNESIAKTITKKAEMADIIERLEKEIMNMEKEFLTSMLEEKVPKWFYQHALPTYGELLEMAVFLETDVLHWVTGFMFHFSITFNPYHKRRLEILKYAPSFKEDTINEILDKYLDSPKPSTKLEQIRAAKKMALKKR